MSYEGSLSKTKKMPYMAHSCSSTTLHRIHFYFKTCSVPCHRHRLKLKIPIYFQSDKLSTVRLDTVRCSAAWLKWKTTGANGCEMSQMYSKEVQFESISSTFGRFVHALPLGGVKLFSRSDIQNVAIWCGYSWSEIFDTLFNSPYRYDTPHEFRYTTLNGFRISGAPIYAELVISSPD